MCSVQDTALWRTCTEGEYQSRSQTSCSFTVSFPDLPLLHSLVPRPPTLSQSHSQTQDQPSVCLSCSISLVYTSYEVWRRDYLLPVVLFHLSKHCSFKPTQVTYLNMLGLKGARKLVLIYSSLVQSPSPCHPSTVDETWYWPKHVLCSG